MVTIALLVGADVLLNSPASRLSTVFARPTHWLAAWMDPRQPLIPQGALATSPAAPAPTTPPAPGAGAVKPKVPGQCPPGFNWDATNGLCIHALGQGGK